MTETKTTVNPARRVGMTLILALLLGLTAVPAVDSQTSPSGGTDDAQKGTVSVLRESGWSDLAGGNQGTHLASDDVFWGVAVIDSATSGNGNSDDWDWGYSLIPESRLSSQLVVGHAPGRPGSGPDGNPRDNGSLAFVVAVTDTVIYVDLDQDGWPDPFDLDGDGRLGAEDVWGVPEWDECVSALGIPVQAGQVLRVGDPFDRNLEGTRIYTRNLGEHIAAAWGEDPNRADMLSYRDLGYTLLPLGVPNLVKTDSLPLDADGAVGYIPGETILYARRGQQRHGHHGRRCPDRLFALHLYRPDRGQRAGHDAPADSRCRVL